MKDINNTSVHRIHVYLFKFLYGRNIITCVVYGVYRLDSHMLIIAYRVC